MGKNLYVGNLPFNVDEEELRAVFSADGRQVTDVHVVKDRDTGRPRGFAFVTMASDEDAASAISKLNGTELGGRNIRVDEAQERQRRTGGGRQDSRGGRDHRRRF
jgi:RNA recognition motif-containing protein